MKKFKNHPTTQAILSFLFKKEGRIQLPIEIFISIFDYFSINLEELLTLSFVNKEFYEAVHKYIQQLIKRPKELQYIPLLSSDDK